MSASSWSLYLFDPEDRAYRRPWASMLPAPFHEVTIVDSFFQRSGGRARDGVVVVHASRLPDEKRRGDLVSNARQMNLHLVLISGGHQSEPARDNWVYFRRRPVRMRDIDEEFVDCFARFWHHLRSTDEFRFELLEPARDMVRVLVVLCQGYLLAHVRRDPLRLELPGESHAVCDQGLAALNRLGLDTALATPPAPDSVSELLEEEMGELVDSADWWSPVDVPRLRHELATLDMNDVNVRRLVAGIDAELSVAPAVVVAAYCVLEQHLRASLRPQRA
ncbi:MAG: hypothetical protein ACE5IK_00150 [Acidobacteriota bacterium]